MKEKVKIVVSDPVSGEKLTLHQEDWDKYQEHKRILEAGCRHCIEAYNKKMTE